jgi:hypothetical protein
LYFYINKHTREKVQKKKRAQRSDRSARVVNFSQKVPECHGLPQPSCDFEFIINRFSASYICIAAPCFLRLAGASSNGSSGGTAAWRECNRLQLVRENALFNCAPLAPGPRPSCTADQVVPHESRRAALALVPNATCAEVADVAVEK